MIVWEGREVGMPRLRIACTVAGTLLLLVASACSGDSGQEAGGNQGRTETAAETGGVLGTTAAASENAPKVVAAKDFDVSLFDDTSHIVDHEWFPLEPGTRYVWKGRAFDDEGQRIARRVEFIVTDLTKVIGGVRAIVGWDRDFSDGELGESELVFYAQDKFGNVWHLGEYVEHWAGRELDGGRYWGVGSPQGARAGIQMRAEPAPGTPSYSQGFAPPPWFWQDHARVSDVGVRDCVPATGCSNDVVVTEEFEPRFPGSIQLKYYARGIGGTRVGWRGRDEEREAMVLTTFSRLSPDALAEARARVLEQEHRGFAYGRTAIAEPLNP
jgi:hypothetical protein